MPILTSETVVQAQHSVSRVGAGQQMLECYLAELAVDGVEGGLVGALDQGAHLRGDRGVEGDHPAGWEQATRAAMLARAGSLLVSASASARRGESAGGEDGDAESRTGRNGGEAK